MTIPFEKFYVKRSGMAPFLEGISRNTGLTPLSVYLPPGCASDELKSMALPELPGEIEKAVIDSSSGAALYFAESNYLVVPPFPVIEKVIFPAVDTEPLLSLIRTDFLTGLVLVHLGSYAVGVCRGETLVSSKVGTGLVYGRTKKGGSSSARYQRRRQNQAKEFLERVCQHSFEHLEPHRKSLDYVLYGGPRLTIERLRKLCPFLSALGVPELPLMEVPPLRQYVLESSVARMWSSRVIRWRSIYT